MLTPLFLKLILAHLIGDFLFQSDTWVKHKKQYKITSKYLYLHMAIHLLALITLLQFDFTIAIIIVIISHFIIDVIKLYLSNKKNERFLFVIDQLAHILVLIGVSYYYLPFTIDVAQIFSPHIILTCIFVILVTYAFSVCIKQLIAPWDIQINTDRKSIDGAGKYIGMLERLLVFGFVVAGIWSAVGFLIAAKSVFRFGDLTSGKDRKLTEYVLIGTLLSFGLAILAGVVYNMLLPML